MDTCNYCKEKGHYVKECPKRPLYCVSCKQKGHRFETCPTKDIKVATAEQQEDDNPYEQERQYAGFEVQYPYDNFYTDRQVEPQLNMLQEQDSTPITTKTSLNQTTAPHRFWRGSNHLTDWSTLNNSTWAGPQLPYVRVAINDKLVGKLALLDTGAMPDLLLPASFPFDNWPQPTGAPPTITSHNFNNLRLADGHMFSDALPLLFCAL